MLNELSHAMALGKGKAAAADVMDRLLPLIQEHFQEEEKALRELHSPAYRRCRGRHAEQLAMIQYFLEGKSAKDPSVVIDLLYFLDSLLDGHIDSDRQALGLGESATVQ